MLGDDTYLPSIILQSRFPQRKTIQHDGFISIFISIGDLFIPQWGSRGCDHMVVVLTTAYAISAYNH